MAYAAPSMAACAAFYKESRMKFVDPRHALQEIRGMGHPEVGGASCRRPFHVRGSATPVTTEKKLTRKPGRALLRSLSSCALPSNPFHVRGSATPVTTLRKTE
jgi:hypothetical protein